MSARRTSLASKISRVRQDAYRAKAEGWNAESERLLGLANQLAQGDLFEKPKPRKPKQLRLDGFGSAGAGR